MTGFTVASNSKYVQQYPTLVYQVNCGVNTIAEPAKKPLAITAVQLGAFVPGKN